MITIQKQDYNWPKLVDELKTALNGAGFDAAALMANASLRVNIRADTIEIIHPPQIDEAMLNAVIAAHDKDALTVGQERDNAIFTLKDLRSLANNFQREIALLNQAIYTSDASAHDTATRFNAIKVVLVDGRPAFAAAFKTALVSETGIDINTIGVNNLSVTQQQSVNAFAGRFAVRWANLLMW